MEKGLLASQVIVACVTPFLEDGSIDYPSLQRVIESCSEAGCGILVLGSTGEAISLLYEEKCAIVSFVISLGLLVPVYVGVGGSCYFEVASFIKFCNQHPLSGYLLTTPIYSKPGYFGQLQWFEGLIELSSKPVILYNIPSRTGSVLQKGVIRTLLGHPLFLGIKDSSGDPGTYQEFASQIQIFCGDDPLIKDFVQRGAKGWVTVMGNVWPHVVVSYYCFLLGGQRCDDRAFLGACSLLFSGGNPVSVKGILYHLGKIKNSYVRLPLSSRDFCSHQDIEGVQESLLSWRQNSLEIPSFS